MKHIDNIEKLFKEKFEHFESNVSPHVWSNIQSGIKPGSSSTGSAASKLSIGKIIAGVTSLAIISGSIWYLASSRNNSDTIPVKQQIKTEIIPNSPGIKPNVITGKKPADNSENYNHENNTTGLAPGYIPPAVRSLNHYSADHSQQTPFIPEASSDKNSNEGNTVESSENTSPQSASHKYGKSPEGPTSLIRGNLKQNSGSKSSRKIVSDENQEIEQPPLTANILASSEYGDAPLNVNFSNQGASSSLNWDFGDGSASKENTPSHTFEKPGNYVVRLTAKNSSGISTDKITIEVKSISGIEQTPNVFSPNSDGENDLFFLGLKNISSIEVVISDMSAHIVGGWNSLDGSWNGKLKNGDDAPEGLYFYTVQATGTDGVTHSQKGSISLSRKH